MSAPAEGASKDGGNDRGVVRIPRDVGASVRGAGRKDGPVVVGAFRLVGVRLPRRIGRNACERIVDQRRERWVACHQHPIARGTWDSPPGKDGCRALGGSARGTV